MHPSYDAGLVAPWLAIVSPDGTVSTRDAATGRLLAAVRLPELVAGPVVDPYELPLQLVGPGIGPVTLARLRPRLTVAETLLEKQAVDVPPRPVRPKAVKPAKAEIAKWGPVIKAAGQYAD